MKHKFKYKDIVVYKPNGALGFITNVYTPDVKYTEPGTGSIHTLPSDSEFYYDVFFFEKSLLWIPAKESELRKATKKDGLDNAAILETRIAPHLEEDKPIKEARSNRKPSKRSSKAKRTKQKKK